MTVHITIANDPAAPGKAHIVCSYQPRVGEAVTPAEMLAMDIFKLATREPNCSGVTYQAAGALPVDLLSELG